MSISTINRLIQLLTNAFDGLDIQVPVMDIEQLAMLIHQSMDQGRRVYHTSTHLFDVCQDMNALQTLAALFHDIVYYQLDNGFPNNTESLLSEVVNIECNALYLKPIASEDLALTLCAGVFGFNAGDILPVFGGLNEFLSAVLASNLLQAYLTRFDLLAIVACIEATIPFRGANPAGKGFPEQLAERVRHTALANDINFTEQQLSQLVIDAILLANRDVVSFSAPDPSFFLSTTWLLIEESNTPLNAVGVYSIQEYRSALQRMEKFLCSLNPEHIFHSFENIPDETEMLRLHAAARNNINFSVIYIGAKIVGIAVIEALALVTGGDCSVSMFLGDIRSKAGRPLRAEDFLPHLEESKPVDADLMRVLEVGRSHESSNDLTSSPMTAYMCRRIGQEGMIVALTKAKLMFAGEISPQTFLNTLEPDLVEIIAAACANIAFSRAEALLAI